RRAIFGPVLLNYVVDPGKSFVLLRRLFQGWTAPTVALLQPFSLGCQRRMVPSRLAETKYRPLALTATLVTAAVWTVRVRNSAPVATGQTLTVPSAPPETTCWPSALNATA